MGERVGARGEKAFHPLRVGHRPMMNCARSLCRTAALGCSEHLANRMKTCAAFGHPPAAEQIEGRRLSAAGPRLCGVVKSPPPPNSDRLNAGSYCLVMTTKVLSVTRG
jgi:hypothetical protein